MIFNKLIAVLERFVEIVKDTRKRISSIEDILRNLNGILTQNAGSVQIRGVMNTSTEELRVAMQSKGQFDLECVQMDVQFSSAIYMAASPRNRKQIQKMLEEKQVLYCRTVLENHVKLNNMADFCDDFMKNAHTQVQARVVEIQNNVKKHLCEGEDSVISKMNISAGRYKAETEKVEKALKLLDAKIKEVDAVHIQARAIVADHVKPTTRIQRPGAK